MRPYRDCHRAALKDLGAALEKAARGECRVVPRLELIKRRGSPALVGAPGGIAVDTLVIAVESDLDPWVHHRRHGAAFARVIRQHVPAHMPWEIAYRHQGREAPLAKVGPRAQPRGWLDPDPSRE